MSQKNKMKFILASTSPRRQELLKKSGYDFTVVSPLSNEEIDLSLPHEQAVERVAYEKAKSVFNSLKKPTLAADTVVIFEGEYLCKPKDVYENKAMLERLSGKTHEVITAYAFITIGKEIKGYDLSKVTFRKLSKKEIDDYAESGSGLDKAGGYGIQDGLNPVEKITGSFTNVMGLPMEKIEMLFKGGKV